MKTCFLSLWVMRCMRPWDICSCPHVSRQPKPELSLPAVRRRDGFIQLCASDTHYWGRKKSLHFSWGWKRSGENYIVPRRTSECIRAREGENPALFLAPWCSHSLFSALVASWDVWTAMLPFVQLFHFIGCSCVLFFFHRGIQRDMHRVPQWFPSRYLPARDLSTRLHSLPPSDDLGCTTGIF